MKTYRYLLFDADETLFDFLYAEKEAFRISLCQNGIEYKEEYHGIYTEFNKQLWKQLELGKITKQELLATRFQKFFEVAGITGDAEAMKKDYQENLGKQSHMFAGALELCKELAEKYELYLVTNGVGTTQRSRLAPSGLLPYLKDVFISEELGFAKPQKEFFDKVAERIPGFQPEAALVIGDSLTSDILGGNNAGIDTCWYNLHGETNHTKAVPTYTVTDYGQLLELLGCENSK